MPTIDLAATRSRCVPALRAGALVVAALCAGGCQQKVAPPPEKPRLPADELVVALRPGPATYFQGPDGAAIGLDADLMRLFAARKRVPLRIVPVSSGIDALDAVAGGRAHVGVGGLYRPVPPRRMLAEKIAGRLLPGHAEPPPQPASPVLWSTGYFTVEPVLVYNAD